MGACTVALAIVVHTTPIALTLLDDRDQPAPIMYVVFCFSIPVPIQYWCLRFSSAQMQVDEHKSSDAAKQSSHAATMWASACWLSYSIYMYVNIDLVDIS